MRITTRTLGAIRRNLEFLNPMKYGSFAFMLFSHKVMRFLAPVFILGAFLSNLLILGQSGFFVATLVAQAIVLTWAILSLLFGLNGRVSGKGDALKLLSFLCLAVVPGTRKFITGSGFKVQGSRFWVLGSGKATKIRLTSSTDR